MGGMVHASVAMRPGSEHAHASVGHATRRDVRSTRIPAVVMFSVERMSFFRLRYEYRTLGRPYNAANDTVRRHDRLIGR